jgi:hypothetical protein
MAIENHALQLDFGQLPDPVYHDLIGLLQRCTDQREKCTPTPSASEYEHVRDQTENILELLEEVTLTIAQIVGTEEQHRRHVNVPARSAGRLPRSSDDDGGAAFYGGFGQRR